MKQITGIALAEKLHEVVLNEKYLEGTWDLDHG